MGEVLAMVYGDVEAIGRGGGEADGQWVAVCGGHGFEWIQAITDLNGFKSIHS